MIEPALALEIADAEAKSRGWGGIDPERYTAAPFMHQGRSAWCVKRKRIMIGHSLWFMLDAETGAVLEAIYRGPR